MRFKVEPRLLDHFGIAMYNTIPKAIAELCANAYDADAARVDIKYGKDEISIRDNGAGMSRRDVDQDYLRLGRDRREGERGGEKTDKGRPVIGNKGIGKLAGFGIAQTMIVRTWRDGTETTLVLDREKLEQAADLESFEIKPRTRKVTVKSSGTEVRLCELLEDINLVDETTLREYLARHLPSRRGWAVFVNDIECTAADIAGTRYEFSDEIKGFGKVTGYYIVARVRRKLRPGFAIRIRDRIVQEPSLFGLNQQTHGYFNLVRIVGELNPEFIDPVEGSKTRRDKFVINTSRSGFNPEDPAVQALEAYAKRKLETIAGGLAKQRSKARKQAALKRNPEFEKRLKALGPDVYEKLDQTIESVIAKLSKNENNETVDEIVDLMIRYYESDALRIILETIGEAAPNEVERLSRLLATYGAARVGEVAEMLHTQLEVIELLRQKVADGVLEAEIHKIIAENIWLIRDDLTYWFSNKQFATKLAGKLKAAKGFEFASGKRPDLVCYDDRTLQPKQGKAPKRLVIVEFKRPGIKISSKELGQVMLYKNVFEAALGDISGDDIDVIILGDEFDPGFSREDVKYSIMSYEELLANARDRYRELYERLAPDGLPNPGAEAAAAPADGSGPKKATSRRTTASKSGAKRTARRHG
jgi:Histidine kinase-, DNA gyrase B-, and HSP90-like ATPase